MYFDNSPDLNLTTEYIAKTSAYLRFGSYLPLIGINDRNFSSEDYHSFTKKILFLDGYFNQKWNYYTLNKAFSQLKLKQIELNKKYLPICKNDVVIHVKGWGFPKNIKSKYLQNRLLQKIYRVCSFKRISFL